MITVRNKGNIMHMTPRAYIIVIAGCACILFSGCATIDKYNTPETRQKIQELIDKYNTPENREKLAEAIQKLIEEMKDK